MMACKRLRRAVLWCRPSAHIVGMQDICRSLGTLDWFLALPGIDALVPEVPFQMQSYAHASQCIPTNQLRRWLRRRREMKDIPILFDLLEFGGDVADFEEFVALEGLCEGVCDDCDVCLAKIILGGNLSTISWVLDRVHFSDKVKESVQTARRAIDSGNVEVPTLVIDRGYGGGFATREVQNYTFNTMAGCGNVAMLQWAKDYYGAIPRTCHTRVWWHAMRGHHLPEGKSPEAKRVQRKVFRFLMHSGVPAPPRILTAARVLQGLFRGARARGQMQPAEFLYLPWTPRPPNHLQKRTQE